MHCQSKFQEDFFFEILQVHPKFHTVIRQEMAKTTLKCRLARFVELVFIVSEQCGHG